jgi:hypothetical protein
VSHDHIHHMAMKYRTDKRRTKQEKWETYVIYLHLGLVNALGIIKTIKITHFNCLIDVNFITVSQVCRVTL